MITFCKTDKYNKQKSLNVNTNLLVYIKQINMYGIPNIYIQMPRSPLNMNFRAYELYYVWETRIRTVGSSWNVMGHDNNHI